MPRRLAALALAVALLTLAASAPAAETLRLGYIPVGDCLQLFVAQDLGYFNEAGLDVQATPFKGGPLIALAVEAGELDAGWSNTVSLAIAHGQGFDFAVLAPGAFESREVRVHRLLVRTDSPIASLADLKGRTVAINNLGNVNEIAVTALLASQGLSPSDIRLVEVPFPQMATALANGSVDVVLALEPFVTLALRDGTARILEPAALRAFGDNLLIAAWFARAGFLAEHPATAEAFRRAVLRASAFITGHPDQAREILTRHTQLSPDLAKAIALPLFKTTIDDAEVQGAIDVSARFGFLKDPFPAAELLGGAR